MIIKIFSLGTIYQAKPRKRFMSIIGIFRSLGLTILPHENSAGGPTTGFGIAVARRPKIISKENTADDSADADGCLMRETMLLVSLAYAKAIARIVGALAQCPPA